MRDMVQNSATSSPELQEDHIPFRGTGKLVRSGVCVSVQGVQGNLCEVSRTNLQGQDWTPTMCKSPTIDTLKQPSRMFGRN